MSERVVRLDELTSDQRRLVLALIQAGKSSGKEMDPAMVVIAEPSIQSRMHSEYDAVQTGIERIGPAEAEAILIKNTHNRSVKARVGDMAREMAEGRWILNGESIKITSDGTLSDGQHRLLAVVESGATIETVVVRGLPASSQETVDTGIKRSLSDVLSLRGETSCTTLAAALMLAWRIDRNGHPRGGGDAYAYPTTTELLGFLEVNPGMRASAVVGHRLNESALRFPPSQAAALHYLMSRLDPDQGDEFWFALSDGVGLMSGHPILTLRKYLIRDLSNPRRMDTLYRTAITIKAWNAYRKNRSLHVIKWIRSGEKPEDFPVIR